MKEPLGSCHLFPEPARQTLFRVIRSEIDYSRGSNTTNLEYLALRSNAGEICLEEPIYREFGKNSSYFVTVGLETYRLKYGKNRIGRFDDNDIVVDNIMVSRRHCCVVVHSDERMEIFDTASKHGTMVNGQKVQQYWLKPSDEIMLAKVYVMLISSLNRT